MTGNKKTEQRRQLEKIVTWSVFLFAGYMIADLCVLAIRDRMLPLGVPPSTRTRPIQHTELGRGALNVVISRNIFSLDGKIPDPRNTEGLPRRQETPVPSQLPLNLIGTLVHSKPEKSIAAIEIRGRGKTASYSIKSDIENMATVEKIERFRVTIRNNNNGRLEYIEMKGQESRFSFGASSPHSSGEVKQVRENEFELTRATINKHTANFQELVMQARAVPARRGGTGEIYGFRITDIQPGSIFSELGIQRMDVITGVNGSPVRSPQEAMELYQALRNAKSVEIQVERNGRTQNLKYSIRD